MEIADQYKQQLDDAIFQFGESKGRIIASMSVLTDALLTLNALEVYYQKPVSKSVAPAEILQLRQNITAVKELLRQAAKAQTA